MATSNMAASGLFGLKVAGLSFRPNNGPRRLVVRAAAEDEPAPAVATTTAEDPKTAAAKAPAAKPPPIGPKRGAKVTWSISIFAKLWLSN